MKAIIVVDMQKDFCDYGPINVKGCLELANKINLFLNKVNRQDWYFVFSRDWHPHNHMSFKYFNKHCVKKTIGSEYIDVLKEISKDLQIKKGTQKNIDSFSVFYKNKRKHSQLAKWLQKHDVKEVYICGVLKEVCVLQTANDGINLGFNTYVIDDLTLGIDENLFLKSIDKQVKFIHHKDILAN